MSLARSLRSCLAPLSIVAAASGVLGSGAALTALTSCADEDIAVKYAEGYHRAPANISFLGLFKDGRVNADVWDPVNEGIDRHLHGYPCAPLYSHDLTARNRELAEALDDYTRANGVGDELLEKLAPMAKGDVIAVVVMAGQPPKELDSGAPPQVAPSGPMGGTGRRGRMGSRGATRGPLTDRNVFELSVSLYSVKTHQALGEISMSYAGKTIEDAYARFAQRFAVETSGSSCTGWTVDPADDGAAIRKLAEDER